MAKCFAKLKDLEDESKGLMPPPASSANSFQAGASTNVTNRTVNSSMSGNVQGGMFNGQQNQTNQFFNKNQSEYLVFKNITEK